MAELLVYSEKVETARELVAGGKELGAALGLGVSAVALGPGAGATASELAAAGADKVYVCEDAAFDGWPADAVAAGPSAVASRFAVSRKMPKPAPGRTFSNWPSAARSRRSATRI